MLSIVVFIFVPTILAIDNIPILLLVCGRVSLPMTLRLEGGLRLFVLVRTTPIRHEPLVRVALTHDLHRFAARCLQIR